MSGGGKSGWILLVVICSVVAQRSCLFIAGFAKCDRRAFRLLQGAPPQDFEVLRGWQGVCQIPHAYRSGCGQFSQIMPYEKIIHIHAKENLGHSHRDRTQAFSLLGYKAQQR